MPDEKNFTRIINGSLKRRKFLKGAAAATVGAAVLGSSCGRKDIYKDDYPDVSENKVRLEPNGKSVLILGGGFGGMHAACELLDRGFDVTIIEKSNMIGGKLKSWRDKNFGTPPTGDPNWIGYPRDHGAHAVWGFYNNLREFMNRHDYKMWKFPREATMYNFLDKDGSNFSFGHKLKLPAPLSRIETFAQMMNPLEGVSGVKSRRLRGDFLKMASFDFDSTKQRMYLDSVSFPEWARSVGFPERVIYRFFGPMTEMAMFDHIDNTSALYTMMLISLTLGNKEDLDIDLFMHPPGETYCSPLEQYIRNRGGQIIYNTPVIKLNRDGARIKSVMAGEGTGATDAKMWKCSVCGSAFSSPNKPSRCPVCNAPASQINSFSSGPPKEFVADYYVLAMDTPGAKDVVSKSNLLGDEYFDNIMKLDKVSVFPVDIWYSNCKSWVKRFPANMDFFPSSFKYLGITLNWAFDGMINGVKIAEPIIPALKDKNVCVIETQIANAERVENLSDEEIVRLVHEELKIPMPDLPEPTDFYVNRWNTYSPQRPGYEALRPTVQSPIDNLFLIGDWVRTDHMSVYMEKTNVASRIVTNLLLDKIGQKKGKITILRSGTPSTIISALQWMFSVKP